MNTRALLPLMPLLMGCVIITTGDDDNADDDSTSGEGDGDPSGEGDGDPSGDGDGDGDPSGEGDGDPSGDGDGDPPEQWCGLDEGPDEPWFILRQFGQPLEPGDDLAVECGFQGFFMIEVNPDLGGFIPTSDYVSFEVTLDVEGFNVGPEGHFAASQFNIFVGCCEYDDLYGCYYQTYTFQLFPPDSIPDLTVIHGAPAQLSVRMLNPGEPVEQTLELQMWALEQNEEWEFCSYSYYPAVDPLPVDGLPIPDGS